MQLEDFSIKMARIATKLTTEFFKVKIQGYSDGKMIEIENVTYNEKLGSILVHLNLEENPNG